MSLNSETLDKIYNSHNTNNNNNNNVDKIDIEIKNDDGGSQKEEKEEESEVTYIDVGGFNDFGLPNPHFQISSTNGTDYRRYVCVANELFDKGDIEGALAIYFKCATISDEDGELIKIIKVLSVL
eukprot:448475_1